MIGEIITASDLKDIQREGAKDISTRAYLAPTVFRKASSGVTGQNYYASLSDAIQTLKFILGKSSTRAKPAGQVKFTSEAKAQTLGISVDFFNQLTTGVIPVPYGIVKQMFGLPKQVVIPFRFYKTDGSGPYYAILDSSYMGIAASTLNSVPASNVSALDDFHREVQLLKARYNTLATYLNILASKPTNTAQQQSFNEGKLLLDNLKEEMRSIKGVEFVFGSTGVSGIGVIPIVVYIIVALIVAAATAWTIDRIITEKNKTARINAAFDVQKWISNQELTIDEKEKQGLITHEQALEMKADLKKAMDSAAGVIKSSSAETQGVLDKLLPLATIAVAAYAISKFVK